MYVCIYIFIYLCINILNTYIHIYIMNIELPVSLGEALDKLTILDIKLEKIKDDRKKDVEYEYNLLFDKLKNYIENHNYYYKILKKINVDIWEMQDDFRYNKGDKVKLCFKIIEDNDSRFRIKKKINDMTNSTIKEQKGYNKKKAFVLTHLGLGDNITAIGMVRYLSTVYDEVLVVCKNKYKENVELFYNDDASIKIMSVDGDNNISPNFGFSKADFDSLTKDYDLYMCGSHNLNGSSWDIKYIPLSFYEQVNIDSKIFWNYFHIPNSIESTELYSLLQNMKYVFVHNISSTGTVFTIDIIEEKLKINKNEILFVNPNVNCYSKEDNYYEMAEKFINYKLANYIEIIKNAEYNILCDSSFMCMAINLNDIVTNNNYYYSRSSDINYDELYNSKYEFNNLFNKKIFKNFKLL